jgi:hypothetical protein
VCPAQFVLQESVESGLDALNGPLSDWQALERELWSMRWLERMDGCASRGGACGVQGVPSAVFMCGAKSPSCTRTRDRHIHPPAGALRDPPHPARRHPCRAFNGMWILDPLTNVALRYMVKRDAAILHAFVHAHVYARHLLQEFEVLEADLEAGPEGGEAAAGDGEGQQAAKGDGQKAGGQRQENGEAGREERRVSGGSGTKEKEEVNGGDGEESVGGGGRVMALGTLGTLGSESDFEGLAGVLDRMTSGWTAKAPAKEDEAGGAGSAAGAEGVPAPEEARDDVEPYWKDTYRHGDILEEALRSIHVRWRANLARIP